MIARMHSTETKMIIQRLSSKKKGSLEYDGQKLSIYPDVPAELREQQAKFNEIRGLLRNTTIKYGVVHPAKLLITFNEETHSFLKAEDAMEFYVEKIKPTLELATEQPGEQAPGPEC